MADNQRPPNMRNSSQLRDRDPLPLGVPRSQYANSRSSTVRTSTDDNAPRYFSAPFRAPPSRQDRHDSLTDHQRSLVGDHNTSAPTTTARFPQTHDRTSYAMFESRTAIGPLNVSKKSYPSALANDNGNSAPLSSQDQLGIVRQASIGHKAKPALMEMRRPDSSQTNRSHAEPKTPTPNAGTIEALNAAITAASKEMTKGSARHTMSRHVSNHRAPYDSPTSTYSQDLSAYRKSQHNAGTATLESGRVSPLEEEDSRSSVYYDPEPLSPLPQPTPHSEKSSSSTNPLLGLGIEQPKAGNRLPEDMRPPRLDMKAVEQLDSRGSVTSLPDLIRRATRLASNLDRGKTASRFGFWDFFGNTDQSNARKRESTFSDVLNSFPDPASGTPTKQPRASTIWPGHSKEAVVVVEKQNAVSETRKNPRRCCGMSMFVFIIIIVIVILLIAAAVLIPIFLVVIPREHHNSVSLGKCAASRPCKHGGISLVDNNACSCICVDGFTGSDCSKVSDSNCVTADIGDGSHTYYNATLGNSILPLVSQSQSKFNIPLNNTALLAVFAANNLSCASENSLVQLDTNNRRNDRRFIIVHGLNADDGHIPYRPVPVKVLPDAPSPTPITLLPRQTDIQTTNNIVYQATSTQGSAIVASTTASTGSVVSASATISNNPSSPTKTSSPSSDQVEFGQIVVLYVLARSHVPSTAVIAQQNIEQYLRAGGLASGNTTVDLGQVGNVNLVANFAQLAIIRTDGQIVAGNSTTS